MFKNYLKAALRRLWKSKAFSAINSIGFSAGLAVCPANDLRQGSSHFLYPVTQLKAIHLYSNKSYGFEANGNIAYVNTLSAITILLLLIGCAQAITKGNLITWIPAAYTSGEEFKK